MTSPLCFLAVGQAYVDVEAERAAAEAQGRVRQSDTQPVAVAAPILAPATVYGADNAPSAPGSTAVMQQSDGQSSGQNLGNLFFQIQQLQQEVMRLNGKVEEQSFQLQQLQEQSRQRYVDLDKRLSGPGSTTDAGTGGESARLPAESAPRSTPRTSGAVERPGEGDAYRAAYALVLGRQFDQAVPAFQSFLRDYPDGKYIANAHYWLGELYLVMDPPDLESARQSFAMLISQYPDNSKAPDALFKLGTVQFMKGNREKAREYLDLVIQQYSSSNSAVVKLARDFIAENY